MVFLYYLLLLFSFPALICVFFFSFHLICFRLWWLECFEFEDTKIEDYGMNFTFYISEHENSESSCERCWGVCLKKQWKHGQHIPPTQQWETVHSNYYYCHVLKLASVWLEGAWRTLSEKCNWPRWGRLNDKLFEIGTKISKSILNWKQIYQETSVS